MTNLIPSPVHSILSKVLAKPFLSADNRLMNNIPLENYFFIRFISSQIHQLDGSNIKLEINIFYIAI